MNVLKQLFDDSTDRGVSPVIGVILMVAITVILAAVIGTFVLNLSNQTGSAGPTAQLSVSDADADYNNTLSPGALQDFVTISHNGGADLAAEDVRIVVRYAANNTAIAEWDQGENSTNIGAQSKWFLNGGDLAGDTFATGDAVTLQVQSDTSSNEPGDGADYIVQVIHPESEKQLISATVEVN